MTKIHTKASEREVRSVERAYGGAGHIVIEPLLDEAAFKGAGRLFAKVVVKPSCELGHHEHHDEVEAYYILSRSGVYEDNGKAISVEGGDVLFCEDGSGHGIKNTGTEDLVFIALILSRK